MIKDIKAKNDAVQPSDRVLAKLHAEFPQCFTNEGKFDLEKFKTLLNDKVDVSDEGYDLNFLGKNYANLIASTETETVIQPDIEHNSKPENKESQNIYISGDNLDALKHLLKSYSGKVKCIYIDPPYNTGSDGFVYNDKFNFTPEQIETKLGVSEEKAKRILDLCKRGSASHSAWLMFMAPRLMLARDLLTEDGVIFISIDDNEQANLKLLCDGVFGEENFVATLKWKRKKQPSFLATHIANVMEYVLVYAREKHTLQKLSIDGTSDATKKVINVSNIESVRKFALGVRIKQLGTGTIKAGSYVIRTMTVTYLQDVNYSNGRTLNEVDVKSRFSVSQSKIDEYIKEDLLFITQQNGLRRDVSESEIGKRKSITDLLLSEWGDNQESEDELKEILGDSYFDYSKPTLLIKNLIKSNQPKDCIVVDFFSGSATTAHSIFQLNTEDDECKAKFILVQLPESLDESIKKVSQEEKERIERTFSFLESCNHPHTLDYIGFERIRRASAKIKSGLQGEIKQKESQLKTKEEKLAKESQQVKIFEGESPLAQEIETLKGEIETKKNTLQNLDWGFKHFTLQDVPQNTLDKMETFDPNVFDDNSFLDKSILESFGAETVLATWMVKDGYGLTQNAEPLQLADYTAYHCGGHIYMIDGEGFDEKAMIALVDKYGQEPAFNPHNVVLFGYSFTYTQTEMLKKNLSAVKKLNESINIDIRY